MARPGRILIIEDHTLLRAGLRALLSQGEEFEVVGEFDNGRDAVRSVGALAPDLILMDLSMPGMNGIEAITEIKQRNPAVRIMVLTIHRGEEYIQESLRAGANGYVLKDASHDELRVAIRSVLNGKTYLSPDVSSSVVTGYLGKGTDAREHVLVDVDASRARSPQARGGGAFQPQHRAVPEPQRRRPSKSTART